MTQKRKSDATNAVAQSRWWVYMILTDKNTLYTGITVDVARRFAEHQALHNGEVGARGAKYFRSVKPIAVVYCEPAVNRAQASVREAALKKLTHMEKSQLIQRSNLPPIYSPADICGTPVAKTRD